MEAGERQNIATFYDALGHKRRILIIEKLLPVPQTGLSFGKLASETGMRPSVLKHHLRIMDRANLLMVQPKGRETRIALSQRARNHLPNLLGLITSS